MTLFVNFHCHSNYSDGEQPPEVLAASLAAAGVRYAALTDHDSIEGLPRFQETLRKRGVACLTGVELTTVFNGREAHLLGYGFDPQNEELAATLLSLRQARNLEVHSIAGSLRKMGASRPSASAAPNGQLEISEAIALLHRAGGRAFWAHPLLYESDPQQLERLVAELQRLGLDGLEAHYAPYSDAERALLRQLAAQHGLLVCAGSDYHGHNGSGRLALGITMPRQDWKAFRAALFSGPAFTASASGRQAAPADGENLPSRLPPASHSVKTRPFRRRSFALRIFLPTLLVIALFLAAIWGMILPSFEQSLLGRKRELIRELTHSAWSILASYERDVQSGLLTREQAQAAAAARVEALRYGPEGKDYFWIQDLQPRMVMHPYRPDLNGQDLTSFTDARGAAIFVAFADLVRQEGEGYIEYVWQWNDDPQRLAPKESFVMGFAPWGWVIGTGMYTDDVNREIARIEQSLINASLGISGAMALLLLFVLQQSLRIERQRQEVLDSLRESTERYHSLVEATTEGALLILDERCRYANPTFLAMTGYTAAQLEFLELADLLPAGGANDALWARLQAANGEPGEEGESFDGALQKADGRLLECVFTIAPMAVAGQRGLILLARDVARSLSALSAGAVSHAAQAAPLGIFRARAARRGALVEMNPAARALFSQPQPALADLFADPAEYEGVLQALLAGDAVDHHLLHIASSDATTRFYSLSARLERDEREHTAYIDGVIEDVTAARKEEAGREALIEKLQASLLFLHEPIARLGREVVVCEMNTSVAQLAREMTAHNATAALVVSGAVSGAHSGAGPAAIGIVTDHDLRARVLAEGVSPGAPVLSVMSAPLVKIREDARIYEALMQMEERGVRHLAVEDSAGQIVSVVDSKALIQFQRYGAIVLAREISRAAAPGDVARLAERAPSLAKTLLDSGARPRYVTHMLSSICDAATERLVSQAIEELGPPPAGFAFVAMGSQGRQEQTLVTDQDNGIIYLPAEGGDAQEAGEYFLQLGQRVCAGLNRAGYALCRGGVMASNPRWRRTLTEWTAGFDEWAQHAAPQEIMELSIFFDLRTVYGDADLTRELRRAIHLSLAGAPGFFHHLAQNALTFKPPFRLLGNLYLGGGATEHAGEINLKDAMAPMVSFARLYALKHQIHATHTLERIEALAARNLILPSSRDEIVTAYDFLMQLRLENQSAALQAGRAVTNIIHPARLGYIQKELLKQAFAQIAAVQKKISYDFLGGV